MSFYTLSTMANKFGDDSNRRNSTFIYRKPTLNTCRPEQSGSRMKTIIGTKQIQKIQARVNALAKRIGRLQGLREVAAIRSASYAFQPAYSVS
mgnify:CR=1 FL=1